MQAKFTGHRALTILLVVVLWSLVAPWETHADVYQGTVVDAETGEPLSDAVLVVVWWTAPYVRMDGPRYFHDAKETVTDSQGKFSVDVSPGIDWNPLTYIESRPTIVIYKPGYRPLNGATAPALGFRNLIDLMDALKKGVTVKLPKLRSREEAMNYISVTIVGTSVPYESIPNLVRLVNIQSKMAGVKSSYPEPKKGDKSP